MIPTLAAAAQDAGAVVGLVLCVPLFVIVLFIATVCGSSKRPGDRQ